MIELLVTVSIASILMAIAAPNLLAAYQQHTVTSQANELVNVLTQARSEAIRRNSSIRFCRTTSESSSTCATTAANWQYWITLAGSTVINRGFIKTQAGLQQTSTIQSITFAADGMAYQNQQLLPASYIQLKAGKEVRCLNLRAGNRTNVTTPTDTTGTGGSCS